MTILRQCCALNIKNKRCQTLFKVSDFIPELEFLNNKILYYCMSHYCRQCFSDIIYITPNAEKIKHKKFLKSLRFHAKLFIRRKIAKEELLLKTQLDLSLIMLILKYI